MELDENVDTDMMDEDTTEDTMMELHYDSTESDDQSPESDDESNESDHERLESDDGSCKSDNDGLTSPGPSYEHLVLTSILCQLMCPARTPDGATEGDCHERTPGDQSPSKTRSCLQTLARNHPHLPCL